jgi:hypothetical protein
MELFSNIKKHVAVFSIDTFNAKSKELYELRRRANNMGWATDYHFYTVDNKFFVSIPAFRAVNRIRFYKVDDEVAKHIITNGKFFD